MYPINEVPSYIRHFGGLTPNALVTYLMLEQNHPGELLFQTILSSHIRLNNTWVIRTKHREEIIDAGLGVI